MRYYLSVLFVCVILSACMPSPIPPPIHRVVSGGNVCTAFVPDDGILVTSAHCVTGRVLLVLTRDLSSGDIVVSCGLVVSIDESRDLAVVWHGIPSKYVHVERDVSIGSVGYLYGSCKLHKGEEARIVVKIDDSVVSDGYWDDMGFDVWYTISGVTCPGDSGGVIMNGSSIVGVVHGMQMDDSTPGYSRYVYTVPPSAVSDFLDLPVDSVQIEEFSYAPGVTSEDERAIWSCP